MRSSCGRVGFFGMLPVCALLGVATADLGASVVIPFPFTANFEASSGYAPGALASDPVWTIPPALTAEITTPAFEGDQALSFLGNAWLGLSPSALSVSSGYPVTWVDFYVRPAYTPLAELSSWSDSSLTSATGFIRTNTVGEVYALDGGGTGTGSWIATGKTTALSDERPVSWQRISYRIDYQSKRWDLYVNGSLTLVDLGFINNSTNSFSFFGLKGSATKASFLDYFYAGDVNPLYADSDNDGLPDSWLAEHGLTGTAAGRGADPDLDGVDNIHEYLLGLNPSNPDTDGDGVFDGRELARGANPLVPETRALSAFPFTDSFESDAVGAFANGTRQWSVSLGASPSSVAVAAAPAVGVDGQRILTLAGQDARVEREFAPVAGTQIVWLDFRVSLASRAQPSPSIPKDVGAVFYVSTAGDLVALDGSGANSGTWSTVGQIADLNASAPFHRYTLRLDYAAQRWSLWLDNVLIRANLGFANHIPYFSGFKLDHEALQSGKVAGLDAVRVATTEPDGLDNDNDGLTNANEVALGTNPDNPDTDGDGLSDLAEVEYATNPLVADTFLAQLAADAQGNLVWRAYFSAAEGYVAGNLHGQQGWRAGGASTVTSAENARLASADINDTAQIERLFGNSGLIQPWISFRARLKSGPLPSPTTITGPVSCLFGFSAEKTLSVYNPALLQWVAFQTAVNAADWNYYTLRLDYQAHTWSLRLNGVWIAQGIPFRDTELSRLARFCMLQTGGANQAAEAMVDDLVVANVDPLLVSGSSGGSIAADTDGDGLPDIWEIVHGLDPLLADSSLDPDGDGLTNLQEYQQGRLPRYADAAVVYYVNANLGNDPSYNGRSAYPGLPSLGYGPKATIGAALTPAATGDRILLVPGPSPYDETSLRPNGRHLIIQPSGDVHVR